MTTQKANRIAVFIDAENVTNWIKNDGVTLLIEELKQLGQIIIRRAYGVWSRPQLAMHQASINQNGFELIHCYHPVTGKNTADIQMTVDVIECAWQLPNINYFVLVTGDSDFSPVFRRLREMDKEVIGVGRHSTLSECVKTSCSRFIYTDECSPELVASSVDVASPQDSSQNTTITQGSQPCLSLAEAQSLVIQQLKATPDAVNTSQLKNTLKQKVADFKESDYGFKTFTDFLKATKGVHLNKVGTVNYASLMPSKTKTTAPKPASADLYKSLLSKHNMRLISADTIKKIYKQACTNKQACSDLSTLRETVFVECHKIDNHLSKTDINKAFTLFVRMDLVYTEKQKDGTDAIRVKKIALKDFLLKLDKLIISTLIELKKVNDFELKAKELKKLTMSTISKDNIKKIIGEK
ncbi:NYN domain-containing protein [Methylomonas sp. ZR1]|uniref:NYN domain-containing protein n=1 Tax=Methylomonas sp. ZR1 TaxID=1797072 RepID=UPI001492227E|nr:NYN domain-containing protein [Methylomonas sp. ZR1]NOV29246.1 NYN domain-containing protein [Methylomonas sp. ZR1]